MCGIEAGCRHAVYGRGADGFSVRERKRDTRAMYKWLTTVQMMRPPHPGVLQSELLTAMATAEPGAI